MTTNNIPAISVEFLLEHGYGDLSINNARVYKRDDVNLDHCVHISNSYYYITKQCGNISRKDFPVDDKCFCMKHLKIMKKNQMRTI